jgi:hypothetical protein
LDDVDYVLKAGAKAAWAAYVETLAAVPAASVYTGSLDASRVPPYIQLDSTAGGERRYQTGFGPGADYWDPRKLTVKVWGTEAQVKAVSELAKVALCPTFALAAGAGTVLSCFPGDERLVEDDAEYQGNPLWRGEVEFAVNLQRQMPAALTGS